MIIDPRTKTNLSAERLAKLIAAFPPHVKPDGTCSSGAARLVFPSLKTKTGLKNEKDPTKLKYNATVLLPPGANTKPLTDYATQLLREAYPKAPLKNPTNPNSFHMYLDPLNKDHALRDQAQKVAAEDGGRAVKTYGGYVPGALFIVAKSGRDGLKHFHRVNGEMVPVMHEELDQVFYGGCWVEMNFNFYKSPSDSNPGLACGLIGVSKLVNDATFGGGKVAEAGDFTNKGSVLDEIEDPNSYDLG